MMTDLSWHLVLTRSFIAAAKVASSSAAASNCNGGDTRDSRKRFKSFLERPWHFGCALVQGELMQRAPVRVCMCVPVFAS